VVVQYDWKSFLRWPGDEEEGLEIQSFRKHSRVEYDFLSRLYKLFMRSLLLHW